MFASITEKQQLMIMNTSDHEAIENLSFIINKLNRYIPIVLLILGSIGHILNILVFARPPLRTNSCSIYLISGSIASFVSLYVYLITSFLATYNRDPTQKSNILCEIRFYLRYSTITLSTWFILFACIDRLFTSSNNAYIRLRSSLYLAKRTIVIAIILVLFVRIHKYFIAMQFIETIFAHKQIKHVKL
ncbi:unnamed protein product [Rotaria socialis]|uniref:G-protein coupled receptors family 1 profile domain-containing protein n=2 Tax=Rotaria socialis TaxID=392032 RepID=A0A818BSN6_9BILA|nr:unnamed protein product [Rotaria socialis]